MPCWESVIDSRVLWATVFSSVMISGVFVRILNIFATITTVVFRVVLGTILISQAQLENNYVRLYNHNLAGKCQQACLFKRLPLRIKDNVCRNFKRARMVVVSVGGLITGLWLSDFTSFTNILKDLPAKHALRWLTFITKLEAHLL